jgi:glycerol-3-phosphate dehydrogenase (NAD(P)+)
LTQDRPQPAVETGLPPVLVLGAGAWGTAIAIHLARRAPPGQIGLWARSAQQAERLIQDRENKRYLPGHELPEGLTATADLSPALRLWRQQSAKHGHGLLVLACPVSGLAGLCDSIRAALGPAQSGEGLVWLCKGLVLEGQGEHHLSWPSDLVGRHCPGWPSGALSGPSFAQEVAKGLPVALTLASQDLAWARQAAYDLHGGGMRVYASDDLMGVQIGGAIKNVLAIAAGVADTMSLGANARAALITRGLAEAARLGQAMGANPETFLGLATLGDLVLTATGDLSRNRRVGMGLAAGKPLDQVLTELGHVAEGVPTAPAIAALGDQLQVELPITKAVCRLLAGQSTAHQAMEDLLTRDPTDEVRL